LPRRTASWCTWQVDRGDALLLGASALMVSPQAAGPGRARADLVRRRDKRYGVDTSAGGIKADRVETDEPEWINPNADYWWQHGKGFAVDVVPAVGPRRAQRLPRRARRRCGRQRCLRMPPPCRAAGAGRKLGLLAQEGEERKGGEAAGSRPPPAMCGRAGDAKGCVSKWAPRIGDGGEVPPIEGMERGF
jgi:hypothetical protein